MKLILGALLKSRVAAQILWSTILMIEQRSTIALIVVQTLLGHFPNKNAPHALKPIQTA